MATITSGILIVFEGIDGTGKSTQLQLLHTFLENKGYAVVSTREPTNGSYGRKIRALYQHRDSISREDELQLFLQDRREHVASLIKPSLDKGKIVLCDRYYLSTAAYQGAAGLDPETILEANSFAPEPDLAFIFEIPPEQSVRRITENRGDILNDFEQLESLKKVDSIFRSMHLNFIKRIDATKSIAEVEEQVKQSVMNIVLEKSEDQQRQ